MNIREVMTAKPRTCSPGTSLSAAGKQMLDGDCGILPVVENGKLLGVVSDRDLFIALATRDRRASEMTLGEVVQGPAWTCSPDDDVHAALARMKEHRVRRLPVTDSAGRVVGIVSMNDLLLATAARKPVHEAEVLDTLQTISAHYHPEPQHAGAR
jgi:CBS domain-containing protein